MDPYEQYLLDAEYEDYLKQAEAEDLNKAIQRSNPVARSDSSQLGADYTKPWTSTAGEAAREFLPATGSFLKDAYNFAMPFDALAIGDQPSGPFDTTRRAGVEGTARTVGPIAAGTAGAAALAPWGAGWGSVLGPWGTLAGGTLAGAIGFAGGVTGFDMTTDAATDGLRPASEYGKDFIYNTTQGAIGGALFEGARAVPGVKKIAKPFTQEGADARVLAELDAKAPGWYDTVNQAFPEDGAPPPPPGSAEAIMQADPFLQYKSLGELLDNPVLKNQQRTLARTTPEGYGRATEANIARNDAQLKYLDQIEQSPLTPADTQAAIARNVESDLAVKQGAIDSATSNVESAVAKLPPPIDLVDAGSTIRSGVAEGLDAQRGRVTAGFEGAGDSVVGREPILSAIQQEVPKYFRDEPLTGDLASLVKELTREGEPVMIGDKPLLDADGQPLMREKPFTVKDMQLKRSRAIEIVKGSDARSAAVAGKIIKAIDESFDEAVNSGSLAPAEVASLREGISARKAQGDIFEGKGNPSKAVLDTNYSGSYSVPDSAVPNKYFRPGAKGTREAMQNYKKAFGNTPEALEPIYRYATDSFRRAAVGEDGLVNTKKAKAWLEQHAEALKEAPELRQQFENIERAQVFLNEKFGDMKRTAAEVQKGALQLWLKDIDPKVAIKEMLSGKDMSRRIKSTVDYLKSKNDPDAILGLKRGIIEHMEEKVFEANAKVSIEEARLPNGPRFDGKTRNAILATEWNRIRPDLERSKLYTDSQMKNFDYLYKDKASQVSVENSKMPGGSDTIQNSTTLAALTKMAGNTFLKGYPITRYIVSFIEPLLRSIPEGKFLTTLEEANLNPRFARDLQNKANAKNITRSVELIFKDELAKAFGRDTTPGAALKTGAGIAAPFAPAAQADEKAAPKKFVPKPFVPRQQAITSKKSFPTPEELLKPPSSGKLQKSSFNVQGYIDQQSPETRARIGVESSGNPMAVSRKGAQGLSQLMPETAQDIADDLGETYMPLSANMTPEQQQASIEQNVRFGDYYYKKQLKRFKKPTLAWAAYNAGPERVQEAMAMAGSETDVNKILSNLPRKVQKETVPYVNNIIARLTQSKVG